MKIVSIILWAFILCLQLVITDTEEKENARFGVIAITNIFFLFYLGWQIILR